MYLQNDNVGKIILLLILSPIIIIKSLIYKDLFLILLGISMLIYNLYKLYNFIKKRKIIDSKIKTKEDIKKYIDDNIKIKKNIKINFKKI